MLLAICICAQAKNDPSQTNINRAATNTNFFIIICFFSYTKYIFYS